MLTPALRLTLTLRVVAAVVASLLALRAIPTGRKEEQNGGGVRREREFGKRREGREKVGHPIQG